VCLALNVFYYFKNYRTKGKIFFLWFFRAFAPFFTSNSVVFVGGAAEIFFVSGRRVPNYAIGLYRVYDQPKKKKQDF